MDAIEKRARELLARMEKAKRNERGHWCDARAAVDSACDLLPAIIAALTPPEGHVVVTRNEAGQAVAVTRQDDEGRILPVIAEFEPVKGAMGNPISIPDGYVMVPVEPTDEMVKAVYPLHYFTYLGHELRENWARMLAARPEVPDGR